MKFVVLSLLALAVSVQAFMAPVNMLSQGSNQGALSRKEALQSMGAAFGASFLAAQPAAALITRPPPSQKMEDKFSSLEGRLKL
ncbi:unnamed protein product, partial [Chrysoparadoxa australica]